MTREVGVHRCCHIQCSVDRGTVCRCALKSDTRARGAQLERANAMVRSLREAGAQSVMAAAWSPQGTPLVSCDKVWHASSWPVLMLCWVPLVVLLLLPQPQLHQPWRLGRWNPFMHSGGPHHLLGPQGGVLRAVLLGRAAAPTAAAAAAAGSFAAAAPPQRAARQPPDAIGEREVVCVCSAICIQLVRMTRWAWDGQEWRGGGVAQSHNPLGSGSVKFVYTCRRVLHT